MVFGPRPLNFFLLSFWIEIERRQGNKNSTCVPAQEALMRSLKIQKSVMHSRISSMIAHSPIVVAEPIHPLAHFPYGFERADIIILDWIVSAPAVRRSLSFAN
jgi:hypothetical protein